MIENLPETITIHWQTLNRDEFVRLKLLDIALLNALLTASSGNNNLTLRTTEMLLLVPYYEHITGLLHRLQALSMYGFISCYKKDNKINIIIHPKTYALFDIKERGDKTNETNI